MKVCVVSYGDAYDKRTWSGTTYNLVTRFEKYSDVEVVSLNLQELPKNRFYNFPLHTVGKAFYMKRSTRDPLVFRKGKKRIQDALDKVAADIYLFCPEYA